MSASDHNPGWKATSTIAAIVALCVLGAWSEGAFDSDSSTTVETLSTSDGSALAAELNKASKVQGVCYGWRLRGSGGSYYSSTDTSATGSNLGDGRALGDVLNECDKGLELVADVTYTSGSSDAEDSAVLTITEYNIDLPYTATTDLARFGVTEQELINDPVGAVARGVLALPLLVAEYDLAAPVSPPNDTGAAPSGAPIVGSDFLRDRGWLLIAAIALLLCATLGVLLGFRSRRRQRQSEAEMAEEAARRVARQTEARKRRKARQKSSPTSSTTAQPAPGNQSHSTQSPANPSPESRAPNNERQSRRW